MTSREEFFERLERANQGGLVRKTPLKNLSPRGNLRKRLEDRDFRLQRFREIMISQNTEIVDYPRERGAQVDFWVGHLQGITRLAYSSGQHFHSALDEARGKMAGVAVIHPDRSPPLTSDAAKMAFAEVQLGITSVMAAFADTGSLFLIPSPEEPRSLSLVPPFHIAFLSREKIFSDFREWLEIHPQLFPVPSPSNAVLISGPSKTADIEKRLVYGVHGPCRLMVVLTP